MNSAKPCSEQGFVDRVAAAWQHIAELFGYRLRPETGATFTTVATLASATLRGLILMALSTPDIAEETVSAWPFGAAGRADWTVPTSWRKAGERRPVTI